MSRYASYKSNNIQLVGWSGVSWPALGHEGTSDCVKNVILSEAKDLKWPKNEILRYTQNLHMLPMPR